jgi:SAM domain (Sterile alpha motif)
LYVAVIHAESSAADVQAWLAATFRQAKVTVWAELLAFEPAGNMLLNFTKDDLREICGLWGIPLYNELHREQGMCE